MAKATKSDRLEPVREAEDASRFKRELQLPKKSWDAFNEILDRPAKPVTGLTDLLRRATVFSE